ncbi:hypothetical protein N0754_19235 [Pseudomonas aeruginosa]|nr:hypothetical protein [Pseudomonas aeruginosa]MCS9764370.1 hypothetical protein [Pseudomonas aeruginosa]MCS9822410.1 hypothetical protein [Pseudomonas aeruginosa]MCT0241127.1 hypothetical protein [Pseudomonas aeruginosa]MCT0529975.1 hypothetical protein [Pseudomonas aeruginosa]
MMQPIKLGHGLIFGVLLAGYLGYVYQDIEKWDKATVGMIGSGHVDLEPQVAAHCKGTVLVEVAPNADGTAMRYRCGSKFWPFYREGESAEMMRFWQTLHVREG